jgi:CDP-glycerol glycerophosphotransferase (TagB/SpsB family)
LVSPSWGVSALLAKYGEKLLDPLAKAGFRIIVRPHPQSKLSEGAMLERLMARYKDTPNLEWDYERENIFSLAKADIMIGDFSGILFDYMFLCDRPVIYVNYGMDLRPYDAHFLDDELWQFRTIREAGIELREENFDTIKEVITSVSDSPQLREARQRAKDAAWQHRGEAGKRTADFMFETVEKMGNIHAQGR